MIIRCRQDFPAVDIISFMINNYISKIYCIIQIQQISIISRIIQKI